MSSATSSATSSIELPLLIEPERLAGLIGTDGLLVLDMRGPDKFLQGHIPGAVNLAYSDIIRAVPPAMGLVPHEDQLSSVLSRVGLTPEMHVVAYDDEGGGRAGRLLWTLDALGHRHFSLLNGGLNAWVAERREVQSGHADVTPSQYQARFDNTEVMADKQYILGRLGQADFLPLDARSPQEYRGEDVRAARGGHIPGAVNINWIEAIDRQRQTRFYDDATLRRLLEDRGVTPDKEIVLYCQTHHRSSHTYMVLKHLGYPKVRGYAGAWSEWGNDPELPVDR